MPFSINLEHFRIFDQTGDVAIRPITLLTGANNAGKSSFLAALRYLSDVDSFGGPGPSFNKDPFFLGSYDQIAHYRGGKYGRSKDFSLGFKGVLNRAAFRPPRRQGQEAVSYSLKYVKRLSQPMLHAACIRSQDIDLEIAFSADWKSIRITGSVESQKYAINANADETFTPELITNNPSLLGYFIENVILSTDANNNRRVPQTTELLQYLRAALSGVPRTSYVGAPVRSRPSRTYDPVDTAQEAEGSHVPSQMAQLARTSPPNWASIRAALAQFGRSSGLFSDFEVRLLGRSDSDPFQLNVVINGPKRNIIDVGYGVSQAIPIVYELLTRRPGMMYLAQQPEVHLHPEAQAALATFLVNDIRRIPGYLVIETHSDFLIDRLRRHVREGIISPSDVSLLYFTRDSLTAKITQIDIGTRGEIENPPEGYREFFLREELENLGFS